MLRNFYREAVKAFSLTKCRKLFFVFFFLLFFYAHKKESFSKQAEEALETAQATGKVAKGTNEVTKFIERGDAALVVIAEDVDPAEIVAHIPVLADEKEIPYVYLPTKEQVGGAAGLTVGTASACIVDAGDAEAAVSEIVEKVAELKE